MVYSKRSAALGIALGLTGFGGIAAASAVGGQDHAARDAVKPPSVDRPLKGLAPERPGDPWPLFIPLLDIRTNSVAGWIRNDDWGEPVDLGLGAKMTPLLVYDDTLTRVVGRYDQEFGFVPNGKRGADLRPTIEELTSGYGGSSSTATTTSISP